MSHRKLQRFGFVLLGGIAWIEAARTALYLPDYAEPVYLALIAIGLILTGAVSFALAIYRR